MGNYVKCFHPIDRIMNIMKINSAHLEIVLGVVDWVSKHNLMTKDYTILDPEGGWNGKKIKIWRKARYYTLDTIEGVGLLWLFWQ